MKTKLLFALLLLIFSQIQAQKYIMGKVSNDSSVELAGVTIINLRTDQQTTSDRNGNYMIAAEPADELRFVRTNYERNSVKINPEHYTKSLNITLIPAAVEIAEVQLGFKPTGNLKKDSKALDQSPKIVALRNEITTYMRGKQTEVLPKNSVPTAFAPPNFSAGQVDILKLVGSVVGLVKKATGPKISEANYFETQKFYQQIKDNIDLTYYRNTGISEYQLDEFLVYADKKFQLAKNYRKNFNAATISGYLRVAFAEYQKTHIIKS